MEGGQPQLGDLLTMVANYLLVMGWSSKYYPIFYVFWLLWFHFNWRTDAESKVLSATPLAIYLGMHNPVICLGAENKATLAALMEENLGKKYVCWPYLEYIFGKNSQKIAITYLLNFWFWLTLLIPNNPSFWSILAGSSFQRPSVDRVTGEMDWSHGWGPCNFYSAEGHTPENQDFASEKWWLEGYFPFWGLPSQWRTVKLKRCRFSIIFVLLVYAKFFEDSNLASKPSLSLDVSFLWGYGKPCI